MDELVEKIEEQRELVAKYEANSVDAKIVADIDGQVNSISVIAGSETTMGQTLCEIVVTELGYYCELNLTAEQAKRVRTGVYECGDAFFIIARIDARAYHIAFIGV